jgi:RHS repeat-associated protein
VTIAPPQVIPEPTPIPWPIGEVPAPSDKDEVKAAKKGDKTTFVNDRIQVVVPESQDVVELKVKLKEAKRLKPGESGLAFIFDIKATGKDKKDISQFSEPITITLQIADLLNALDKQVYLTHYNEDKNDWDYVEIVARDEKAGTVTFATNHFSTYGGGVSTSISQLTSPAAWTMKFNDANVSLFDGALNWNYPLDIPAGPGGVRPYLSISYNSRRVDGILERPTTGWEKRVTDPNPEIAYGWDLDLPEIAWGGIGGWIEPQNASVGRAAWRPYLTLRLNGSSVRVVPDGNWVNTLPGDYWKQWQYRQEEHCTTTTTLHPYRAEDRKDLRIRWVCASADGMNERGQWEVTTSDGTKYVFGSSDDSRQSITAVGHEAWWRTPPAYLYTIRWRLKQMVTTKGVAIDYAYTNDPYIPSCCGAQTKYDFQTYPSTITYPGTKITFNWINSASGPKNGKLDYIDIQRQKTSPSTSYTTVTRYRFAYGTMASPANGVNGIDDGGVRRTLTSITQIGFDGATEVSLPATTFGYTMLPNKDATCPQNPYCSGDWNIPYYYPRLNSINNGYGGTISAGYETPDSGHWHSLNYRLAWREVKDGMNATGATVGGWREEYAYSTDRCYSNPDDPYALGCTWQTQFTAKPMIPDNGCNYCVGKTGGGMNGYKNATVTYKPLTGNGTSVLKQTFTEFNLSARPAFGRVLTEIAKDNYGAELAKSWNIYSVNYTDNNVNSWRQDGVNEPLHYLNATVLLTDQYSQKDGKTTRTEYAYDGFDNATRIIEHGYVDSAGGDSSGFGGDERTVHREYHNLNNATDTWFIGLMKFENVFEGNVATNADVASMKTQTIYHYDGAPSWTTAPTQGFVTQVRKGRGGAYADTSISPTGYVNYKLTYDAWGNLIKVWDPNGYTAGSTDDTKATIATYDANLHVYMTSYKNAEGLQSDYFYYCINDGCPAGGPTGAVRAIRDASNTNTAINPNVYVQTVFFYDAWGRLRKVFKPFDSTVPVNGDSYYYPTEEYLYNDTEFPMRVTKLVRNKPNLGTSSNAAVYGGWWQCASGCPLDANAVATWQRNFYDGLGRLVQTQTPNGTYNPSTPAGDGELVSWTSYDPLGRVRAQSVPSPIAQWTSGAFYRGTDTSKPQTVTQYDPLGQVIGVTDPSGSTTNAQSYANTSVAVDANGHRKDSSRDGLGRTTQVVEHMREPLVLQENQHFQQCGSQGTNVWVSPNATGSNGCWLAYGPYWGPEAAGPNQVVRFRLSVDVVNGWEDTVATVDVWDASANIRLAVRDLRRSEFAGGVGNYTEFALVFDTTNRAGHPLEYRVLWHGKAKMHHDQTSVIWAGGQQTTSYIYNIMDNLTGVTDAKGNGTTMTYDALGRKKNMTDQDMGTWQYTYDENGNLKTQADHGSVHTLSFVYDKINRVTSKWDNGVQIATYGYGTGPVPGGLYFNAGRRTSANRVGGASQSFNYDRRGRLLNRTDTVDGVNYVTSFTYDSADRAVTMTYPDAGGGAETVTSSFNMASQPKDLNSNKTVGAGGSTYYVTGATYNALGQPKQINFGNNTREDFLYFALDSTPSNWFSQNNSFGRLAQKSVTNASSQIEMYQLYSYDKASNVAARFTWSTGVNTWEGTAFNYDALDRLTNASPWSGYTGEAESYSYDSVGNLLSKAGLAETYGDSSHKHAVTKLSKSVTVRAAGSAAYGMGPHLQLWVNGQLLREWDLPGDMVYRDYSVEANLTGSNDKIEVVFTNDAGGINTDRNLFVLWVRAGDQQVSATDAGVVYDRGNAFDNVDVITYVNYGCMCWSGGLRFFVNGGATQTVGSYAYDANGNMTSRAEYGVTYTQNWNEDNKLSSVSSNGASTTFAYDADGNRIKKTESGSVSFSDNFGGLDTASWGYNTAFNAVVDEAGQKIVRLTSDNNWRYTNRTTNALSHGKSVALDFRLDNINSGAHFVIEDSINSRFGVVANGGNVFLHYISNGGGWSSGATLVSGLSTNLWYRLTLTVDDVNGFKAEIRQRDSGAGYASATWAMPTGRTWHYKTWTYGSSVNVWLDNYIERNNATLTTVYIGGYFEKEIVSAAPPTNAPLPTAIPTSIPPTNTPTPGPTATSAPPTNTPPPAATATPTPGGGCSVLDCFTTSLSSNWMGDTGSFSVSSSQLVAASDKAIYWNTSYSGDVWASIKLGALSGGQVVALHLRAINNYWTNGVIEVGYTQGSGVTIYTFDGSSWVNRGTLSASFANGDVFKAASSASGTVTVYKNGTSIGSADVSGWSGHNRNGQIGLWTDAGSALLDDFDGGGGGATSTPPPTTMPTQTPTPTPTSSGGGGCGVLDCFTSSLSGNWTGDTSSFSVSSSQLQAASDKAIYWNATYSGDMNASIKINALSSGQVVALHLRAINNYWTSGVIEVVYTHGSGVAVYTFDGSSWVNRGSISASFASGDVFKAVSSASGTVMVYKNGTSMGSADVTGWSGYNRAGQIGLWTDASGALLDDFNGGTGSGARGAAKVWAKPAQPAAQQQSVGSVTVRQYYFFNGGQVAMRVCNGGCSAGNPGAVYFLHGDHLGSASLTTSNAGAKIAEARYAPFGETRYQWSSMPTDRRFTSQRLTSYGTISFPAREYSPLLGRFLSADSIVPRPGDPQSLNRYSFVRNNPMSRVDRDGHCDQAADRSTDACWKKYDQVTRRLKLGYETGIDVWDLAQLTRLERRLAAGTKFTSVDIKDPTNPANTLKAGKWNANNFSDVLDALDRVDSVSSGKLAGAASKITFNKLSTGGRDDPGAIGDWANAGTRRISLHLTSKREEYAIETAIHGIGHLLDGALGSYSANNSKIWGTGSGSSTDYGNTSAGEDFAESFTWMVENRKGGDGFQNNGNSVYVPSQSRQDAFANLQVSKGP